MSGAGASGVELTTASYDDPAVVALTGQVQDYYREIYGGPDDAPLEVDELRPPGGLFMVARIDEVAVGMGGWRLAEPRDGSSLGAARPAEVRRMFVIPEARHQGVARSLLRELERTALAAGVDAMILSTGSRQTDAVAFYRSCGYAGVAPFGHWGDAPGVVCLGRRLP